MNPPFQVIEEILQWNSSTPKTGHSVHDLSVNDNHSFTHNLPRFYNANLGAIIHFNTPRGCTPRSSKSIRTIAPFLKSTRNSGVPSKSPVNELICGSCPTNSKLGSRRNARTSAHVSIGDAIGVNFEDSDNSSS